MKWCAAKHPPKVLRQARDGMVIGWRGVHINDEGVVVLDEFAMREAQMILAAIARRFHVELVPDAKPIPMRSITLRLKGGLQAVLKRRA